VAAALWLAYATLVLAQPTHFLFDDAFFYLQIARHVAEGHGSTFHGLGSTNGYHPLWLAACVPLVALADWTGISALHLVLAVQLGMTLGMAWLYARWVRQLDIPYPVVALAYGGTFFLAGGLWGSEGMLVGLLQLAALSWLIGAHAAPEHAGGWLRAGVLLGLAVLARLDLIFLAAVCCASALVQPGMAWRTRLRATALLGLPVAALLAPYLLANAIWTGHLVPISGALKSSFPTPHLGDIGVKLGHLGRNSAIGSALCLALSAGVRGPLRRVMAVLGAGALVHAAYVALFNTPGWATDSDYYWVTSALATSLAASALVARLARLRPLRDGRRVGVLASVLAALVASAGFVQAAGRAVKVGPDGLGWAPEFPAVRLGRWLGANLPADARVFTPDSPGRLAWFSGRPVLAADGLTHGWDFADALRRPDLEAWLSRNRVSHVVAVLSDVSVPWARIRHRDAVTRFMVLAPWTGEPVGELVLPDARAIVTLREIAGWQPSDELVGVWRWPVE
jgi:hypothetical protein